MRHTVCTIEDVGRSLAQEYGHGAGDAAATAEVGAGPPKGTWRLGRDNAKAPEPSRRPGNFAPCICRNGRMNVLEKFATILVSSEGSAAARVCVPGAILARALRRHRNFPEWVSA